MSTEERRLAAIVFTDIVGFTKLSAKNEPAALALLETQRSLLQPIVQSHGGEWLKELGDGLLLSFENIRNAVDAAIAIQNAVSDIEYLDLRIGIHQGEVIFSNNDVMGDDVNIAARIEPFAATGGIAISDRVNVSLERDPAFTTKYIGKPALKGVSQRVEVYCITSHGLPKTDMTKVDAKLEKEETASIAILPFENKGAPDDEFYAYGISYDLIADVARAGLIRVAGLKDVEMIDYAKLNYDKLAKTLLVRYVAQGTLWKLDSIFQLFMEIFDTKLSKVAYTKKWQTDWKDLATIKDHLSNDILDTLKIKIKKNGQGLIIAINPDAYEYYLRAEHKFQKRLTTDDIDLAMGLSMKAIELDNNFVEGQLQLANIIYAKGDDDDKALKLTTNALAQAEALGNQKTVGDALRFIGEWHIRRDPEKALEYFERSLNVFEKLGDKKGTGFALNSIGNVNWRKKKTKDALEYYDRFLTIAEEIGDKWIMSDALNNIALIHNDMGDSDAAIKFLEKALRIKDDLSDKAGSAKNLVNIGFQYFTKGDFDTALVYYNKGLAIDEALVNKWRMAFDRRLLGFLFHEMGDYAKALEHFEKAYAIDETLDNKNGVMLSLKGIGIEHYYMGDYDKALDFLERSYSMRKELGKKSFQLYHVVYLYLTYKHFSMDYDAKEIHRLIDVLVEDDISYVTFYPLYLLFEEDTYLEKAYQKISKIAHGLNGKVKEIFLNAPIPKQIVEAWEKVNA